MHVEREFLKLTYWISRQDGAVMSTMFTITLNNFSKCQLKHFFVSEFPFKGFVCPQIEEKICMDICF